MYGRYHTIMRRLNGNHHLHGFQQDQLIPGLDPVANAHEDFGDDGWDGRGQRTIVSAAPYGALPQAFVGEGTAVHPPLPSIPCYVRRRPNTLPGTIGALHLQKERFCI